VNEAFAGRLFGAGSAIGQRVSNEDATYHIVGVVKNSKSQTISEVDQPILYRSLEQNIGLAAPPVGFSTARALPGESGADGSGVAERDSFSGYLPGRLQRYYDRSSSERRAAPSTRVSGNVRYFRGCWIAAGGGWTLWRDELLGEHPDAGDWDSAGDGCNARQCAAAHCWAGECCSRALRLVSGCRWRWLLQRSHQECCMELLPTTG